METASSAEFRAAMDRVFADAMKPVEIAMDNGYRLVMKDVARERKKWDETLFSPAGLKMIFRR